MQEKFSYEREGKNVFCLYYLLNHVLSTFNRQMFAIVFIHCDILIMSFKQVQLIQILAFSNWMKGRTKFNLAGPVTIDLRLSGLSDLLCFEVLWSVNVLVISAKVNGQKLLSLA